MKSSALIAQHSLLKNEDSIMRNKSFLWMYFSLVITFCCIEHALSQSDPHAGCAAPPSYIPANLLQREVPLRTGAGNSHDKITTSSKEAQAFYDQGVNYLDGYVWIEASRSFHQALRHDPDLAMAYVGLSYVHSGIENAAAAKEFLEKAKSRASKVSDYEKRRIEIREKQLAALDSIEDVPKHLAYKKAIDDALAKHLSKSASLDSAWKCRRIYCCGQRTAWYRRFHCFLSNGPSFGTRKWGSPSFLNTQL